MTVVLVTKMNIAVETIMIDGIFKTSAMIKVKVLPIQKIPNDRIIFSEILNFFLRLITNIVGRK